MGPIERWVRHAINPISTGLTVWWLGVGRRQVPSPSARSGPGIHFGVASPGDRVVPPGLRPGWQWLPEFGASPTLRAMPWLVRVWYRTPLIDRYAYEWMWWHGGWSVWVSSETR